MESAWLHSVELSAISLDLHVAMSRAKLLAPYNRSRRSLQPCQPMLCTPGATPWVPTGSSPRAPAWASHSHPAVASLLPAATATPPLPVTPRCCSLHYFPHPLLPFPATYLASCPPAAPPSLPLPAHPLLPLPFPFSPCHRHHFPCLLLLSYLRGQSQGWSLRRGWEFSVSCPCECVGGSGPHKQNRGSVGLAQIQ